MEYFDERNWVPVTNQQSIPSTCANNDVNIVEFTPIRTRMVRIVFSRNEDRNHFVGLTEMEIWTPRTDDSNYEAEDGWIINGNIMESSSASGGSYVSRLIDGNSFVEFTGVWVDSAGDYDIQVYYANGESVAAMNVRVNNIHTNIAIFPTTGSWSEFSRENYVTINVPLLRGNNVLVFHSGINFVELDKIVVDSPPTMSSNSQRIVNNDVWWKVFIVTLAFTQFVVCFIQ